MIYIHADESCLGNQYSDKPTPGGAAGLVEAFDERKGWIRRDYYVSEPDTTNNRMALRSAIEGLSRLRKAKEVIFYSDSNYLVQGMKDWIHNWAERGWRRKGGAIENLELWRRLDRVAARFAIEWRWVRGHAGDPKNEYVNNLAVRAAREQLNCRGLVATEFDSWIREEQDKGNFLEFFDVPPEEPFEPDRPPPAARR